jgi:ornithine cyclodeaminase/thiomorpholine-carboxylate dehydrogenase
VTVDVLLLGEAEVERLLDLDALLDALADGFRALSAGRLIAPSRNEVVVPEAGFLLAMPAWQPGMDIAVKLVSVFHGNAGRGLPGHQALICLFDPETGIAKAVLDGTYITAIRTAGGAALATRLLARPTARVLTILGAGVQGQMHLRLLPRVRPFAEIRIGSLYFDEAVRLAATDARARAVESFEDAVRGADVVCLCTTAGEPVISLDWLSPGVHVTSVGYMPPGGELDRRIVESGRLFVETRLAFQPPPTGCGELSGLSPDSGTELGEVLLGQRPGRQSDGDLTVYKSMGHAMEDLVAAHLAYRRAIQEGSGRTVAL